MDGVTAASPTHFALTVADGPLFLTVNLLVFCGRLDRAAARTGGNQTNAAELLDLQRTFLNRLIKKYEL